MNLASKLMKPESAQKLSKAFDFASEILKATNDPAEALKRAGIQQADLVKAQQLLNNPMAGIITKALGVNKAEIASGLSKAQSYFDSPAISSAEQAPTDEIQRLQDNLARIK